MQKSLKLISISSKNTSLEIREQYSLQSLKAENFMDYLKNTFSDLNGIMVLSTCNRTEVYFEAVKTDANLIINSLEEFLNIPHHKSAKNYEYSFSTEKSLKHLSQVACGLKSSLQGDKEIMGQIKKAYKCSLRKNMQGSLLERVMQNVIKIHKRIHNETDFKKGSTSFAYRSLKKLEQHVGKQNLAHKRILLIGAGQIIQEVLAYTAKYNLGELIITNRSYDKAKKLAKLYQLKVIPFEYFLNQEDLFSYDAIITAVSGNKHFITKEHFKTKNNTILIDLAVPANVHPTVNENCKLINIDELSSNIDHTKKQQKKAIEEVENIIDSENLNFQTWLDAYEKRKSLANKKVLVYN